MSDNPVPAIFFPIILIDGYAKFRHDARTGHHGKTAQLWVSYMDHIWLVLQLTKAVKANKFLLYARCLFLK
jgi:hypothetical protein